MGVLVMLCWHMKLDVVVQMGKTLAPMPYNSALGFALCGAGLLLIMLRRSGLAAAACGVVAMFRQIKRQPLGLGGPRSR